MDTRIMCANRGGAIVGFIISRMARQLCDEFAQGRGARIKTRPIAELAAEEGLLPLCVLPRLGDAAFDSGGKAGIHVGQVGELAHADRLHRRQGRGEAARRKTIAACAQDDRRPGSGFSQASTVQHLRSGSTGICDARACIPVYPSRYTGIPLTVYR